MEGCDLVSPVADGTHRFNELQRRLTGVPPRLLIKQLRDLEEDGLVERTVYPVVPPKVEYALSEEGRSLEPFILGLCAWGDAWLSRRGMKTAAQMKQEALAGEVTLEALPVT